MNGNSLSHDHIWTPKEISVLQAKLLRATDEEAISLWIAIADPAGERPASETQTENLEAFWTQEIRDRLVQLLVKVYEKTSI